MHYLNCTDDLRAYYAAHDEGERRLTRAGQAEIRGMINEIEIKLSRGWRDRVLDIGAGTGCYSHALAQRGWRVDAVELVPENIDRFLERTQPGETVTIRQGDARDLSAFPDNTYDVVLLMGPLYELFSEEDRKKALAEAVRVAKPLGRIFAGYLPYRPFMTDWCFGQNRLAEVRRICEERGIRFSLISDDWWTLFGISRGVTIDRDLPASLVRKVSVEGDSARIAAQLEQMDEEAFREYLFFHGGEIEMPNCVESSHQTAAILEKHSTDAAFRSCWWSCGGCLPKLKLHVPGPDELDWYLKLRSEAEPWAFEGFPDPETEGWYEAWTGKKKDMPYFAYLQRASDGAFVGCGYYRQTRTDNLWSIGMVIAPRERKNGCGKAGLRLLTERAFDQAEALMLHCALPSGAEDAIHVCRGIGFWRTEQEAGKTHLELSRYLFIHRKSAG